MYVKHEKLRDLTLGALAAEHDNFLEDYFFESRMFRRVALGYTRVLIGNRGSGKSAIFRMLAKKERQQGTLVEEIMPSDYMYDLLKNSSLFDSKTEWARLGAYTASWKSASARPPFCKSKRAIPRIVWRTSRPSIGSNIPDLKTYSNCSG